MHVSTCVWCLLVFTHVAEFGSFPPFFQRLRALGILMRACVCGIFVSVAVCVCPPVCMYVRVYVQNHFCMLRYTYVYIYVCVIVIVCYVCFVLCVCVDVCFCLRVVSCFACVCVIDSCICFATCIDEALDATSVQMCSFSMPVMCVTVALHEPYHI